MASDNKEHNKEGNNVAAHVTWEFEHSGGGDQ
jgi:hypothetical protein